MNTPHSINNIDPKLSAFAPQTPGHALEVDAKRGTAANIVSLAILNGDMTTLRELGLDRYASAGEQSLKPPAPFSRDVFGDVIKKAETFDLAKILTTLVETAKMLRDAHREMRHAERDFAESEALDAARKIRNGGMFQMVNGVGMGLASVAMGAGARKGARNQQAAVKAAQKPVILAEKKLNFHNAEVKLSSSQMKLSEAQKVRSTKIAAKTEAENRLKARESLEEQASAKADAAETEVRRQNRRMGKPNPQSMEELNNNDYRNAKSEAQDLRDQANKLKNRADPDPEVKAKLDADLEQAKTEAKTANEKVADLEDQVGKAADPESKAKLETDLDVAKIDAATANKKAADIENQVHDAKSKETLKSDFEKAEAEADKAENKVKAWEKQVNADATDAQKANNTYKKGLHENIEELTQEIEQLDRKRVPENEVGDKENQIQTMKNRKLEMERELKAAERDEDVYKKPCENLDRLADRLKANTAFRDESMQEHAYAKNQANEAISRNVGAMKWQFRGQLGYGLFQMFASMVGNLQYAEFQADQAALTAESQKATSRENEETEFQRNANQMLESAMNTLREYFQAINRMEASVIHNM